MEDAESNEGNINVNNLNNNHIENVDSDDEELAQGNIRDGTTKQSFLSLIDAATGRTDLTRIIELLPNSSHRYGHSSTMNAVVKLIARHATFKDRSAQCTTFDVNQLLDGNIRSKITQLLTNYNVLFLSSWLKR